MTRFQPALLRMLTFHQVGEDGLTGPETKIFLTVRVEGLDLDADEEIASAAMTTTAQQTGIPFTRMGSLVVLVERREDLDAKTETRSSHVVITRVAGEVAKPRNQTMPATGGTEDLEIIQEDLNVLVEVKEGREIPFR